MKVYLLLSIFLFGLISRSQFNSFCVDETNIVVPIENGDCLNGPWVLEFSDEFDLDSLDLSKWNPTTGVVRDPSHQTETQWYSPSNIEVSNGTLKLIARKEQLTDQCYTIWENNGPVDYCQDFEYVSAEIQSKNKFSQGKVEIRCKVPKGKGFFPAFWLYGGGPGFFSEIDIFEFWNPSNLNNLAKVVHMNMHGGNNGIKGMCPADNLNEGIDYSEDFHVYTCIWDLYKIEWYFDGDLKYRTTRWYTVSGQSVDCNSLIAGHQYILNPWFPDDSMNIIANFAISAETKKESDGLSQGSGAPDETTPFPAAYEIDYIRYYKKTGGPDSTANFKLYPNPTSGNVTIQVLTQGLGELGIKIFNSTGLEVIGIDQFEGNEIEIDLTPFDIGIYYVMILDAFGTPIYSAYLIYE